MSLDGLFREANTEIALDAGKLLCPDICKDSDAPGIIAYSSEFADKIPGHFLFWGPYLELAPGVYLVTFGGRLDGRLTVDFACNRGGTALKSVVVEDLSEAICLVLMQPVGDLEIRATKSAALRRLSLETVTIQCAYLAAEPNAASG